MFLDNPVIEISHVNAFFHVCVLRISFYSICYSIETLESCRTRHWPHSGDHPVPVGDNPLLGELPRGPRDLEERDAQQQPHVT